MTVVLLLVAMVSAVVVPRAVRAHEARRQAFLGSFGRPDTLGVTSPDAACAPAVVTLAFRRRRLVRRLLAAMAATAALGLLSPFRAALAVHLMLDDVFLAYVALLAHRAGRRARVTPAASAAAAPAAVRAWKWAFRRPGGTVEGRPVLPNLPPVAPVG